MVKFNPENERTKRRYLEWEKEANGKSKSTLVNIQKYLYSYDECTNFKSYKAFNKNDAIKFKSYLSQKKSKQSGELISKTYLLHATTSVANFFKWLCTQSGYKKRISPSTIAYFNLSEKDTQIARSSKTKRVPTLEQIECVIKNMPFQTEVQKRDRALVAFLILTACRVTAIISLKLKHISLEDECVEQNPREVKTKFSKKITTYFFPVGDMFKKIVTDWVHLLRSEKYYDDNAPLFPSTKLSLNANDQFTRETLDTAHLKSTTPIRTIVKQAFENADLPYYNPHSFRDTVVRAMSKRCKSAEEFKAVSQNIGHSSPLITLSSYGSVNVLDQGEIIKRLSSNTERQNTITDEDLNKRIYEAVVRREQEYSLKNRS